VPPFHDKPFFGRMEQKHFERRTLFDVNVRYYD
jgi:hypothetical protein